uniref:26S proteasome non-ATPase regulatory subunit 5 n=1 Tax=Plectus sambesii TaxID=2011161 RepID=A0A914UZ21_9BILA
MSDAEVWQRYGWKEAPNLASIDELAKVRRELADRPKPDVTILARYLIPRLLDIDASSFNNISDKDRGIAEDVVRTILNACIDATPVESLLVEYQAPILATMLKAPTPLKVFLLDQIGSKIATNSTVAVELLTKEALAVSIAMTRQLVDPATSQMARHALVKLCSATPDAPTKLLGHSAVITELKTQLAAENSEARFRIHDLTAELVKISPTALTACVESSLLTALISELRRDGDILGQLNALELLAQMSADSSATAIRLHEMGIIPELHDLLATLTDRPDSGFLFPAVIRFFGYLARSRPVESLSAYPKFMQSVFDLVINFDRLDVAQRLLGFDTLAIIATTVDGKKQLSNLTGDYTNAMELSMKAFGKAICSGPIELRSRHLDALSSMVTLPLAQQTPELLELTKKWFQWLSDSPMEQIATYFKQPMLELRLAAGEIIKALAEQAWGQKMLAQCPGFLEHLLNRGTESEVNGRRTKYEIVKTLVDSTTIGDAFEAADVMKLRAYEKQGAFFVPIETQVAMEND